MYSHRTASNYSVTQPVEAGESSQKVNGSYPGSPDDSELLQSFKDDPENVRYIGTNLILSAYFHPCYIHTQFTCSSSPSKMKHGRDFSTSLLKKYATI